MKTGNLLLSVILSVFVFGCSKVDEKKVSLAITKASKLACREVPSLDGKIIKYYEFGMPIIIDSVSEKKETIDGVEDFWYRDKESAGWLFGGYLLKTHYNGNKIGHFKSEMIRCNVICGGNSCFFQFSPYIINDYYVAAVYMYDYPEDNEPEEAIIIGKCSFADKEIIFYKAEEIIAYNSDGKPVKDILKKQFDTAYFFEKNYLSRYKKHKDEEGDFFTHENSDLLESRTELREKCGNQKITDEIWAEANIFIPMTTDEIRKRFPLKLYYGNK